MTSRSLFMPFGLLFVGALLVGGCTDRDADVPVDTGVPLRLEVNTATVSTVTRSIVSETGTGTGQVGKIAVYLTQTDGHTAYANLVISSAVYTLANNAWSASRPVNLRTEEARLYAWYPAPDTEVTDVPADNGTTRTVPVSLPATQNFSFPDGQFTVVTYPTLCSQTDYLYASAVNTTGDHTAIQVSASSPEAGIYLQHALSWLVFTIEYKTGTVPDRDYDFVKSITLEGPFTAGSGTMQLSDGTMQFPSAAALTFSAAANPQLPGEISKPLTVAYGLVAPKPATTAAVTLKMVLGGKSTTTYDRTLTVSTDLFNPAWLQGNRYVYHLSLGKNNITVKAVEIEGWTEQQGGGADMPPVIL